MKEFIENLISRLEELKKIEQNRPDDCDEEGYGDAEQIYDDGRSQGRFEQTHKIIQIVNQLAEEYNQEKPRKTKKNQEWIPTSERLPEKNAIVLTCDKDGWISVKVNMPYAGVKNDFENGYYTAWMPLPPAYVPKEGRE